MGDWEVKAPPRSMGQPICERLDSKVYQSDTERILKLKKKQMPKNKKELDLEALKKDDKLIEYFLYKHGEEIKRDVMSCPDSVRVLETFPTDQILDFIELVNSNIVICLLFKYNTKLVELIATEIEADKFKLDPKKLKK